MTPAQPDTARPIPVLHGARASDPGPQDALAVLLRQFRAALALCPDPGPGGTGPDAASPARTGQQR